MERVWSSVRSWVHNNITAGADFSWNAPGYDRKSQKPKSLAENLTSAMEDTEFKPPFFLEPDGEHINKEAVHFWVKRAVELLFDLAIAGAGLLFLWILSKFTGRPLPASDEPWGIEYAIRGAIWLGCAILLQVVRLFGSSKRK